MGDTTGQGENTPTMPGPSLLRALRRGDLTALGINQLIGSGIFVLPATVAALVGQAASPLVWIVAAAINALIILCFAEAAGRFREAGGPYLYARSAFGPLAGFQVAWMIWLTRVSTQAAVANAFVLYLSYFWSGAAGGLVRMMVLTAVIGSLAGINFRGIRYGSWVVNLFTVGKLVPLTGFILLGFVHIDWQLFRGLSEPEWSGFGQAILLLMFAFGGFELVSLPAGEARSPRRDVPRALLTTLAVASLYYLLTQLVVVGTLPGLSESNTPLADAAARFLGPLAGMFMAVGALISITGTNAGTMLAGPRVTYALGERGQLPSLFSHIHSRFRTPDFSILIYSAVSLLLALTGTFVQMAAVSAVARLLVYVATCSAVPVLRQRQLGSTRDDEIFRVPGGWIIPLLAVAASAAVIVAADLFSLAAGALALLLGAGIYFYQRGASGPS